MGNQSASFYQRLQSAQSVVPLLEVRRNLDRGSVNLECCTYHVSGVLGRKRRDLPTLGSSLRQSVLAPRARFELATLRLTAECSTIELPGNRVGRNEPLLEKCSEEDVAVSMKRGGF